MTCLTCCTLQPADWFGWHKYVWRVESWCSVHDNFDGEYSFQNYLQFETGALSDYFVTTTWGGGGLAWVFTLCLIVVHFTIYLASKLKVKKNWILRIHFEGQKGNIIFFAEVRTEYQIVALSPFLGVWEVQSCLSRMHAEGQYLCWFLRKLPFFSGGSQAHKSTTEYRLSYVMKGGKQKRGKFLFFVFVRLTRMMTCWRLGWCRCM
jgi:hypothetical protein